MDLSIRGTSPIGLLIIASCCSVSSIGFCTTINMRPRATILLEDGTRFIAQDGWDSVAIYRTADALLLHRFPAPSRVHDIALSPDEKHLLVGCNDGNLLLWRVETGERIWRKRPHLSGVDYVGDVAFSATGERFVVCGGCNAIAFDTITGLKPGTKYHYRMVAVNETGTGYGEDATFVAK